MTDDTVLQFGHSLREPPAEPPAAHAAAQAAPAASAAPAAQAAQHDASPRATSCPTCGSHFSPDGRFCPFDGTPLVPAVGWDPRADTLIGTVVDARYEVLSVLGEGGMGTVYAVRHRALGKRFALKALRRDLASDGEIAARFIQEARTAAAVSHPGLVEITDFGRLPSGQVYFVMELVEGGSLAALLRVGGPMPAARGLDIVRQLVHALKAAHDSGIVHRDLKPDNIHVARGDGERDLVKVVDFGLAKVIGSSKLTRAGMVFGTPHYMSPEQAAGEQVDHRADIYSLGIVMYEMFTGKVPFEADSYMGVLTKHMYMTPAPPSQVSPELKRAGVLEDVILRCLQKRPDARYPDLAALLADLEGRLPSGARSSAAPERGAPLSLLADQIELSSAPPPAGLSKLRPVLVIAGAFALGVLLVLALRAGRWSPLAATSVLAPSSGAPSERALAPPGPPLAVPPAPTHAASPALPSASARSERALVPSGEGSALRAPARKLGRPPKEPSPQAPRPAAPPSGQARKRGLGLASSSSSGEIVDPWAR